jgi:hypothetical protein
VSDEILFADDDSYHLSLVDIDDAGNRSFASKTFTGMASHLMRPETPGEIGPPLPAHKRFLTEDQAEQLRVQLDQKAAADLKASEARATETAKADENRNAALAKIDADAAAARAKV